MNWREFVKNVQKNEGISYKLALQKSSPLWKALKEKKTKNSNKPKRKKSSTKKVINPHIEINEFPASKKAAGKQKTSRKRIPSTKSVSLTNLGGSIVPPRRLWKTKSKASTQTALAKKTYYIIFC